MEWKRGTTLITNRTKKWSKEQIEANNNIEETLIFSSFNFHNQGISRQLVCELNPSHPKFENNRALIEAAPDLLLGIRNIVHCLDNNCLQNNDIETLRELINKIVNPNGHKRMD